MAFAEDGDGRDPGEKRPQLWVSPLLRAVLLAQVLSLLLCVMGTTSGVLAARGINLPTTQAVLNYLLLAATCGIYHLRTRGPRLSNPWYVYLLLAVLDVEANFLVIKAYQFTSITSVTLLDCFTLPVAMALSAAALRARYRAGHLGGALLCVGGLALLVLTDGSSATGGAHPVLGDALVLMGAVLYACSNVAQERLLLGATPISELLACAGTFGALIGGLQAVVLERGAWLAADWSDPWAVAVPLAGFALALYAFALLLPLVLLWSGATVLNLSLLTSDVWAAAARVLFFGGFGGTGGWFALSLVCEAAGLVLYTRAGQTHPHPDVEYDDPRVGRGGGGAGNGVAGGGSGNVGGGSELEDDVSYLRISSFGMEGDANVAAWRDDSESMALLAGSGRPVGRPQPGAADGKLAPPGTAAAAGTTSATNAAAAAAVAVLVRVGEAGRCYGVRGTAEERLRLVETGAGEEAEDGSVEMGLRGREGPVTVTAGAPPQQRQGLIGPEIFVAAGQEAAPGPERL